MKYKREIICFIAGIIIALIGTKLYWPTIELKVEKSKVSPTTHTTDTKNIDVNKPEECQIAKDCANSEIKVDVKAEGNKVLGRAYDDCKYADFEFAVKSRSINRHIFQCGFGWTLEKGYYLRPGYLYKTHFWDIAIGGSVMLREIDPGAEIIIQKAF